ATLHEGVRIVAHDLPVLASARLGLVGVDDKIMRTAIAFLGHEGPLEARREAGPAAASQTGGLHLAQDPIAPLVENGLRPVPMAAGHRALERAIELAIEIGKCAVLVTQHRSVLHRGFLPKTFSYSATPPFASASACLTQLSRSIRPRKFR